MVKETAEQAQIIKRVYPHLLRHSVATTLLERGMPIEQVQKFLGHSKLETTQLYAESSTEMLRESYQRALSRGGARLSAIAISRADASWHRYSSEVRGVRRHKAKAGGEFLGALQCSFALFKTGAMIPEVIFKGRIALDSLSTAGTFFSLGCIAERHHASSKTPDAGGR
jgi:hypothetical protein